MIEAARTNPTYSSYEKIYFISSVITRETYAMGGGGGGESPSKPAYLVARGLGVFFLDAGQCANNFRLSVLSQTT